MNREKRDISMYSDIIELPYVKSTKHPHMSNHDRAAQFAPFAALTGHEEAIKATAGEAEEKMLMSEWSSFE